MMKIKKVLFLFIGMGAPVCVSAQSPSDCILSIEQMFELADRNSRSIKTFDLAEQEAEQAVKVAKNALLPSIDVSLSASYLGDACIIDRDFSGGANAPMPHFGNNFAIEASQVLYAGGAITSNIALAKLRQQVAQLDRDKNRQDIRFLLAGNYLELYKLRNQAEVYQQNIEQTRRLLADITAKEREGLALKNDITRYELQLKSLELALTQIENSQIVINNQLVTIVGLPQETVIGIDTCLLDKLPPVSPETEWQHAASDRLPALKQAELGIRQSRQGEKLAKSERLPSVALFAANLLDGPITIEVPPIDKNLNYWYLGVGVKFNIASIYQSGKNIRKAKIATQRAVESKNLLQENVQTDVKAAYIRFGEAFTIYDTQIKSLELANQNYDIIRNRYLHELALITDMLDASNSKLSAELQVANARINILFNYFKLKKAVGSL